MISEKPLIVVKQYLARGVNINIIFEIHDLIA